jgi:hypothetical protein
MIPRVLVAFWTPYFDIVRAIGRAKNLCHVGVISAITHMHTLMACLPMSRSSYVENDRFLGRGLGRGSESNLIVMGPITTFAY